jgi:hypothetical protein
VIPPNLEWNIDWFPLGTLVISDDTTISGPGVATLGYLPPGSTVSRNNMRSNSKQLKGVAYALGVRTVVHELGKSPDRTNMT